MHWSFENVQIRNHKGIKELTIQDAGKINVICGINNSGKTAILEAMASKDHRSLGKALTEEQATKFARDTVYKIVIYEDEDIRNQFPGFGSLGGEFKNYLSQAISKDIVDKKNWFPNDYGYLESLYEKHVQRTNRVSLASDARETLKKEFDILIPQESDTTLIPAKRNFEVSGTLHNHANLGNIISITPTGGGILANLLIWKNLSPSNGKNKKFQKLKTAFESITNGYSFDVFMSESHSYGLSFIKANGEPLGAENCGMGLQDILIMLFFIVSDDSNVLLIDEPENHIHPDWQRRLLDFIYKESDKRYFIATHSNVFLNATYVDKIYFAQNNEEISLNEITSKAIVLENLGYAVTDNLVSDLIILTEGPSDIPVLEEFLLKYDVLGKHNIKFWPLGGDIMLKTDLTVFSQTHKILALIDLDPGSSAIRQKFLKKCEELKISCFRLKRYAIENYFSVPALRKVFPNIDENLKIDENVKLENQIKIDVKTNNQKIAKAMSISDIKGTDLEEFFNLVKDQLRK